MHPLLRCNLIDRFFFFQDFQRDLCLLTGSEMLSHGHSDSSLLLIFAHFRVQISLATAKGNR